MEESDFINDFFVSFSNKDVDIVSRVVSEIENFGAKCWFQKKDSKAEYVDAIMKGIEKAGAFIVFLSPDSANSYYVLNEIGYAVDWSQSHETYKILPIMLNATEDDFHLPVYKKVRFYLGRLNMLFFNDSQSVEALVKEIFTQTNYTPAKEVLHDSLYHYSEMESERLKSQNEILRDFSKDVFAKTVTPDSVILDIGCANGDNVMIRLQNLEYKKLLGLDIDPEQVAEANKIYGSDKNLFMQCNVMSEKLDDILSDYLEDIGALGFDFIHLSSVLLHFSEPQKLLCALRRYLRKNGYLFIQEEDDGANLVYPNSKFFQLAFKIWGDSKESGDRYCARKLPSYLAETGYSRASLEKCGVSNVGMDKEHRSAFWDIYFNYHLWLAVEEGLFYHLKETNKLLEEYKSLYDNYKKEYDEGKIFIQLGFLIFLAQK